MHCISLIAFAAIIPAVLSRPVPSDPLITRTAGPNQIIEARSIDVPESNVLQGRDDYYMM